MKRLGGRAVFNGKIDVMINFELSNVFRLNKELFD